MNVESLGPSVWSVSLTPVLCGTGIELLQIADATVVSGNTTSDQAVFGPINATENSNIAVSRVQAATPPVSGTFEIYLENYEVKGNCNNSLALKIRAFEVIVKRMFVIISVFTTDNNYYCVVTFKLINCSQALKLFCLVLDKKKKDGGGIRCTATLSYYSFSFIHHFVTV